MSKIARYEGNLRAFASEAQGLERTLFGETTQADDLTSQITASFLRGWGIVGPSEHPSLEDFNAAMYAMSQFIAYQHQMGVPEWHSEQEYYAGSICSYGGELYKSLSNSNVGNEPPSSKWTVILTLANGRGQMGLGDGSALPIGVPVPYPGTTPPAGWLKCNGSSFNGNAYPALAARYPSLTTPDLRGVFIRGWDDARGLDNGRGILTNQPDALQNISGSFATRPGISSANTFTSTLLEVSGAMSLTPTSSSTPYVPVSTTGSTSFKADVATFDASRVARTASETRPVNISFCYIVRAQ